MERNINIDFLRGFAALWIVLVHTCFHSGDIYVPVLVRQIVLIIDVPLFVFLAGYTFHYTKTVEKNMKGLLKIYLYYCVFVTVFFIITAIVDKNQITISNIVSALFFKFTPIQPLISFRYSVWFLPMFFIVSILGSLIITHSNFNRNHVFIVFVMYGIFAYYIKNENLSKFTLYLFFYCLGYYSYDNPLSIKKFIIYLAIILGLNILFKYFGPYGFRKMQIAKFDYALTYLIYSMISVTIAWFINTRIKFKNRFISFVGKNSLLLYLCQGFSSSSLYEIAPKVKVAWNLKLVCRFGINISICLVLFLASYGVFKLLNKPIQKIITC